MSDWSRPGWLEASGWVHLVDGSVAFGCAGDGFIEAVQQFEHGLAFSSSEHRVASVVVGSSRDAADGRYFTESDRAASGEEPLDVGQCRGGYAARLGAVWTYVHSRPSLVVRRPGQSTGTGVSSPWIL